VRGRERRSQRTHTAMRAQCAAARLAPTGLGLVFVANTDAPVLAASTSPPATSAVRRRLHNRCFFLGEGRLKRGAVALPEVAIGDSSSAAVTAAPDGSLVALPPGALRRCPIHRCGRRARALGRYRGLGHHHRGVAAQTDAWETALYVTAEAGTEDLVRMLLPPIRLRGRTPDSTSMPSTSQPSKDCGRRGAGGGEGLGQGTDSPALRPSAAATQARGHTQSTAVSPPLGQRRRWWEDERR
jgi:hypothetical protein